MSMVMSNGMIWAALSRNSVGFQDLPNYYAGTGIFVMDRFPSLDRQLSRIDISRDFTISGRGDNIGRNNPNSVRSTSWRSYSSPKHLAMASRRHSCPRVGIRSKKALRNSAVSSPAFVALYRASFQAINHSLAISGRRSGMR